MQFIESVENTIILLNQFSCSGFRIVNQFRIFDIVFNGLNVHHLQLPVHVCGTDRLWFVRIFELAATESSQKSYQMLLYENYVSYQSPITQNAYYVMAAYRSRRPLFVFEFPATE